MKQLLTKTFFIFHFSFLIILTSCSVTKQISQEANSVLLKDSAVSAGFMGICIYEPATNKYWYNYNETKYFTPASNTKLFTLYAGMKYLGDSLVGLRYENMDNNYFNIFPTGDPTFLHPDFKNQPVLDFFKKDKTKMFCLTSMDIGSPNLLPLGYGWAWDDYNDNYMVERNDFPIYGNIIKLEYDSLKYSKYELSIKWNTVPKYFTKYIDSTNYISLFNRNHDSITLSKKLLKFYVKREIASNKIYLANSDHDFVKQEIPFYTGEVRTAINILKSDFEINIAMCRNLNLGYYPQYTSTKYLNVIHSQPTDSLFKPMMYNSDNFFAEQTLLMASNEHLGYMNDEAIIDTLLKLDLKDVPQKPKWVDGSGLSRYNLFTPQSFVYILNKMKNEFGWQRLKNILPTGGIGTLKSYYKNDSGFIYAKTGTLSNNCSLSGFLITNKGKFLVFSILANHYQSGATPIRKAVEQFLTDIRKKF